MSDLLHQRILVPMSYMSFWEYALYVGAGGPPGGPPPQSQTFETQDSIFIDLGRRVFASSLFRWIYLKTQCLTLGPNLYFSIVLPPTCYFCFVNP